MIKEYHIIEVKDGVYVKNFDGIGENSAFVLTDKVEDAYRFDVYSFEANKIKKSVFGKIKVLTITYSTKEG